MKKHLQSALMLSAMTGMLMTPLTISANDGGLGLTGETTGGLTGLTGESSGLTGEPGLQSTTTESGLLGQDNAFDNSLSSTDTNTTPITFESDEEEEPAFELTEAPETEVKKSEEEEEDKSPILELEEADDSYIKEMDELPKTGFATSSALVGLIGLGSAGMLKGFVGGKNKED